MVNFFVQLTEVQYNSSFKNVLLVGGKLFIHLLSKWHSFPVWCLQWLPPAFKPILGKKKFHFRVSLWYIASFVLKVDDDTYVNVELVRQLIRSDRRDVAEDGLAWWSAFHYHHSVPSFGKWADPAYPALVYPAFPAGAGYLMTGNYWLGCIFFYIFKDQCLQLTLPLQTKGVEGYIFTNNFVWSFSLSYISEVLYSRYYTIYYEEVWCDLLLMFCPVLGSLASKVSELHGLVTATQGEDVSMGIWVTAVASDARQVSVPCWLPHPTCIQSVLVPQLSIGEMKETWSKQIHST